MKASSFRMCMSDEVVVHVVGKGDLVIRHEAHHPFVPRPTGHLLNEARRMVMRVL
jgi:hypothetical protein